MTDQEEVITLDSDDEAEPESIMVGPDLIVGPTGTAVPVRQAPPQTVQKLPLPPG